METPWLAIPLEEYEAHMASASIGQAAIHAGLVFEYVDVPATLAALKRNCRAGGHLAVVLQVRAPAIGDVSPSPYTSLQSLARIIKLVEPASFRTLAEASGFICDHEATVTLASGKSFACLDFRACDAR